MTNTRTGAGPVRSYNQNCPIALGLDVLGDRFGRRFAYQFNLLIFGSMCLCSMFAPSMTWLTGLRFVMGIGIGAEDHGAPLLHRFGCGTL